MASSTLGSSMSFKRFMLRSEVLKLYRDIFRSIRQVSDESHRQQLKDWARHDFRQNKHHMDEDAIRMLITKGRMSLKELESSIHLAS